MGKIADENLMRQVMHFCGGSIDLVDINNEKDLSVLNTCLHHETQYRKRVTMVRALKARIRKMEKAG